MISPERLESMQQQWVRLLAEFNLTPATAYPHFDRLVSAYSEPHRSYHTLEHLAEMFKVAGRLLKPEHDRNANLLAIWYHDVVYDPTRHDNEERSAAYAKHDMQQFGCEPPLMEHVGQLIMATQHNATDHVSGSDVVCDADLAILGASEQRYDRYAEAIRREYQHVPDELYRTGRAQILQQFLGRETIYKTNMMREVGEQAARSNIERELRIGAKILAG